MYIIKNVSNNNIVIGRITLRPGKEIEMLDLTSLQKIINLKLVTVRPKYYNIPENNMMTIQAEADKITQQSLIPTENVKPQLQNQSKLQPQLKGKFINSKLKETLIEAFFDFYLAKDVSNKDLSLLKWFYKNVGFNKDIDQSTLSLLDEVKTNEELVEVLLNNIYPALLEQYIINEPKEQNK